MTNVYKCTIEERSVTRFTESNVWFLDEELKEQRLKRYGGAMEFHENRQLAKRHLKKRWEANKKGWQMKAADANRMADACQEKVAKISLL